MVPMPIGLIVQQLLIAGCRNFTAGADIAQHNHGAAGAKRAGAGHFQSPETLAEGDLRWVINNLAREHQHGETVQGIAQPCHGGSINAARDIKAFNTGGEKRLQGGDVEHGQILRQEG